MIWIDLLIKLSKTLVQTINHSLSMMVIWILALTSNYIVIMKEGLVKNHHYIKKDFKIVKSRKSCDLRGHVILKVMWYFWPMIFYGHKMNISKVEHIWDIGPGTEVAVYRQRGWTWSIFETWWNKAWHHETHLNQDRATNR